MSDLFKQSIYVNRKNRDPISAADIDKYYGRSSDYHDSRTFHQFQKDLIESFEKIYKKI